MARDIYDDEPEVEGAKKDGLGNGLVIVTTLLLLGACLIMQKALQKHFDTGLFADKKAEGNP